MGSRSTKLNKVLKASQAITVELTTSKVCKRVSKGKSGKKIKSGRHFLL
jgi:hypothetical protein